jgi:Pyruvate/2-oxoacid:ferredoxin oxidoreductase delta subunit
MFISVFCLSYHIDAWEETLPEWVLSYLPMSELPDGFIESASLFVIISMLYLSVKRWVLAHSRQCSGIWDAILPGVILAPFVSGYLAMTGQETAVALIDNNLDTIHVLSGNIFLLAAGFLFCRTVIDKRRCVGCVACVNNCPANALSSQTAGDRLIISYAAQRCIHCGTCMKVCDDRASQLRHALSIPLPGRQKVLHTAQMAVCKTCRAGFASLNHLEKLQQKNMDYDIGICPDCRSLSHAQVQKERLA